MKKRIWDITNGIAPGKARSVGNLLLYRPPDSEWPIIAAKGCFDEQKAAVDALMAAIIDRETGQVEETRPQCVKCKNFYPIDEFTKMTVLKTCQSCRKKKKVSRAGTCK